MLRPGAHRRWMLPAGAALGLVLLLGGAVWRLSSGPVAADVLAPAVERWLAAGVKGGRAGVGQVNLAWFGRARALGLQLTDVSLIDGRGRPVLRARRVEAAIALPSLMALSPAPGRIAASDFFAAVSVSPQGRYELGYDAAGAPAGGGGLFPAFEALTGRAARDRPLSFLREVELTGGVLALSQVGGPVSWRGQVRRVSFHKAAGRFDADLDLTAGPKASLKARAGGTLGLKRAFLDARLADFDPARVLPWTGPTARLSTLDALVRGQGSVRWAADRGMQAADIRLAAGEGAVRLGGQAEPFHSAELRAVYDPRADRILIQAARIASARADFDVAGQAWLVPESRWSGPARFELALNVGSSRLALAPWAEPQAITAASLRARFIPRTGRFEIDGARVALQGATVSTAGVLTRPRDARSWGVDMHGAVEGTLTPVQVVALWPDDLNDDVRAWLRDHVRHGRLGAAAYAIRLPVGAVVAHRPTANDRMRLTFDFQDADIEVDPSMPAVEHAEGSAVLQGDRFDLVMRSGQMQNLRLSDGQVRLPKLVGDGKRVEVQTRAVGDAREMLQIVDRSTGGVSTSRGFAPGRIAGHADMRIAVGRPMGDATLADYDIAYEGRVQAASIENAALGLTLKSDAVALKGGLDRLSAEGDVRMGPYRGPLRFAAGFPSGRPSVQKIEFNGVLDAAAAGLSGPSGSTLAFVGRFDSVGPAGHGVIRSKAFDGQIAWKAGAAGRVLAEGVANAAALRSVGVPVGAGVPERVSTRLLMAQTPAGWSGSLSADAYSGSLVLTGGPSPRLRYAAELTPAEAIKIGLPPQMAAAGRSAPVVVDVSMTGESGSADYTVGSLLGQVSWAPAGANTQYHWRTVLTPGDLHAMGLPAGVQPKGPLSVDVTLSDAGQGWTGAAQVGGGTFRFTAGAPNAGLRKVDVTGAIEGSALADLGLSPPGMIAGPAGLSASLDIGPQGLLGGRVEADLARTALDAPYVAWKKPAGRALRLNADFVRHGDGSVEATAIRGEGPGFTLAATGGWRPGAGVLKISSGRLDGAFDGALTLAADDQGEALTARARYFDARELIQQDGRSAMTHGDRTDGKSMRIDAQFGQVRVGDQAMVHNVRINGDWGQGARRRLDVTVAKADGGALLNLRVFPDAGGTAIAGQIADVSDVAQSLFGVSSFRDGQAVITGRMVDGGADLHIEMTKVRLVKASALARILTVGSLHAMADLLDDRGIEFTKVVAPISVRGARVTIGRARATGPAMGVTTQGVIDLDDHTVDLSGGIAPSYVLNSAMGAAPLVGELFVSHKGEGMFGLTYSARGDYDAPKISVNPFSLATPGILRRIFETRSAAVRQAEGG